MSKNGVELGPASHRPVDVNMGLAIAVRLVLASDAMKCKYGTGQNNSIGTGQSGFYMYI